MRNSFFLRKMIELCTFRRMVLFIFLLVTISIVFLSVENYLTRSKSKPLFSSAPAAIEKNSSCWETEEFLIKQECMPCTKFEKISGNVPACGATGFKEVLACSKQGDVNRSCSRVPWLEERNFFIFEACMICSGVVSALTVVVQQRKLERKTLARIQKQIAAEF